MTQWEFDTILEVLRVGVPVLYERLGTALKNVVVDRNNLAEEVKKLKEEAEEVSKTKKTDKKEEK